MRQGKARYVFPGSNTPLGFFSYYLEGLAGLEQIFILKGGPGTGKSTLMRKIGTAMLDRGYDVEFWQCSSDNDSLDGVLIPALSACIVDGTAPHTLDPVYPGAIEELVNLGDHWDSAFLRQHKNGIVDCVKAISDNFRQSYDKLSDLGEIRTKIKEIYIDKLDNEKLLHTAEKLAAHIFNRKTSLKRHLFSSAITPCGLINLSDSLSKDYDRRFILRGKPGNGQETIINELINYGENYGQEMEIFHNTFEPEKVELLLFKELKVAILAEDFTSPIEEKADDTVIEMSALMKEIPEASGEEIALTAAMHQLLEEACQNINTAKNIHDQLETYYTKAMDFEAVDFTASRLFNKILALVDKKAK